MMHVYHGICIGGPRAGKSYTHESDWLQTPVNHDPASYLAMGDIVEAPAIEHFTYRHHLMHFGECNTQIGIWVDAKEKQPIYAAMVELISSYQKFTKLRDE